MDPVHSQNPRGFSDFLFSSYIFSYSSLYLTQPIEFEVQAVRSMYAYSLPYGEPIRPPMAKQDASQQWRIQGQVEVIGIATSMHLGKLFFLNLD